MIDTLLFRRARPRDRRRGSPPRLEVLEDRLTPSITVTTTADGPAGSLRDAINQVNAGKVADNTIILPAGTYTITLANPGGLHETANVSGDFNVSHDLKLVGAGAASTIVQEATSDRVFQILGAVNVSFSGVTVQNGSPPVTTSGPPGGAGIDVPTGTLTLTDCVVTHNVLSEGGGAGIATDSGTVNLIDSTVSDNTIQFLGDGAGISSGGTVAITDSTISGNHGGAVSNSGTLVATGSTFAGNSGGGLFGGALDNSGTASFTNCTFAGNQTTGDGGAIFNDTANAVLNLTNVTISGNAFVPPATGGFPPNTTGGVANFSGGTANVLNTIIAGNSAGTVSDISGTFHSLGHNLIGAAGGSTGFGAAGDRAGTLASPLIPGLGPLADNGGPTRTMALLPDSLALDAGQDGVTGVDQRGVSRPQGRHSDIGAFELQGGKPAPGVGVFDPATATWYLRSGASAGPPDAGQFRYGAPGWLPVAGDWQGSGHSGVGVFDPTTATWYLRTEDGAGAPDAGQFRYGAAGWLPVVGDWNGLGHSGVGVFDPTTATWYLRTEAGAGAPDAGQFRYGVAGGVPVVGDWTGTGHLGVGVFDPATATWYLRSSLSAGAPDVGVFQYGAAGWRAVAGDWQGSGHAGIGVFDPSTATFYLRGEPGAGAPDAGQFAYGGAGFLPVVGAFPPQTQMLLAADGEGPGGDPLSAGQLQSAVAGALARLSAAGVDPALVQALASASYAVGQLPDGVLGETDVVTHQVTLSADAAGRGWFADGTPLTDEEFAPGSPGSPLVALPGSPAAGREDLLSAVLHEMGHLAGSPDGGTGLMAGALGLGTRDLGALDQVFAASRGIT